MTDSADQTPPRDRLAETLRRETCGTYVRSDVPRLRRGVVARSAPWDEFIAPFVQTVDAVNVFEQFDSDNDEEAAERYLLDCAFPQPPDYVKMRRRGPRRGGSLSKAAQAHNLSVDVLETLAKLHPAEVVYNNYARTLIQASHDPRETTLFDANDRSILARTVPSCFFANTNPTSENNIVGQPPASSATDFFETLFSDDPSVLRDLHGFRNETIKRWGLVPISVPIDEGEGPLSQEIALSVADSDEETIRDDANDSATEVDDDDNDTGEPPSGDMEPDLDDDEIVRSTAVLPSRKLLPTPVRRRKRKREVIPTNEVRRKYRSLILARFSYDNKLRSMCDFGAAEKPELDVDAAKPAERCSKLVLGVRGKDPFTLICPPSETSLDAFDMFYGIDLPRTPFMGPPPADSIDYGTEDLALQRDQDDREDLKDITQDSNDGFDDDETSGPFMYGRMFNANGLDDYVGDEYGDGTLIFKPGSTIGIPQDEAKNMAPEDLPEVPVKTLTWRLQQRYSKYGRLSGLAEELYRRLIKYPKESKLRLRRDKRIEVPIEIKEKPPTRNWRSAHETDAARNAHKAMHVVDKKATIRAWKRRPVSVGMFGYKVTVESWRPARFMDEEDGAEFLEDEDYEDDDEDRRSTKGKGDDDDDEDEDDEDGDDAADDDKKKTVAAP